MAEQNNNGMPQASERRRRKPKSKLQLIKENYLPLGIAALAVLLILVFIIGSVSRAVAKSKAEKEAALLASQEAVNEAKRLQEEAQNLLAQAEALAAEYDFEAAIDTLNKFSGDTTGFPELAAKKDAYTQAMAEMVVYQDISAIPNLSFHMLVVDPARAYVDEDFASSYRNTFVTVAEFQKILEQLYNNGYMLVNPRELVTTTTNDEGKTVYTSKPLYLPADKKPIILTETNVNYYTYMVDGNGDGVADKDGAGFASKLIVDETGNLANEYVDAQGNIYTGAYDLVPIHEAFIAAHPDFSLRGARATIAVSGYDGLFGHRTNAAAAETLDANVYQAQVDGAKAVIAALRDAGYEIACYSYKNTSYSDSSAMEIEADLKKWTDEVTPILGQVDMMVYALNSDIGDQAAYSGEKFNVLKNTGFSFFFGYSDNAQPWAIVSDDYVRQGRVVVTGSNLVNNPQYFNNWFDAATVLDPARSAD